MSLTVKAYVVPSRAIQSEFEEIRRFSIAKIDAGIYTKLFDKFSEVFPNLDKDKTGLHWKDSDGDLIRFTTNPELKEALKSTTDGVFKLYVRETPLFVDGLEYHVGIICNECRRPVRGSRFMCMACGDYDLCHGCELKGFHLEHTLIKIPTPTTPWAAQIMQYYHTYGPGAPIGPKFIKKRTEEREARNCGKQLSPIEDRPSFTASIGEPQSKDDWSLFSDPPSFNRSMAPDNAIERSSRAEERSSRRNKATDLDSSEMAGKSKRRDRLYNHDQSPPDKTSGDWTILNSKEPNEVTSTSARRQNNLLKPQAESSRIAVLSPLKEATPRTNASSSRSMSASVSSSLFEDEQEKPLVNGESTEAASDETKIKASVAADGTVNDPDSEAITTKKTKTASSEDGGALPGTDDVSSTTNNTEGEKEEKKTDESGDPKPKVDNNLYIPTIRRYAEALDNLMSMGFTNEGGWLTVLVEEKRGDIIRVLDFIENNIQRCKESEKLKSRG